MIGVGSAETVVDGYQTVRKTVTFWLNTAPERPSMLHPRQVHRLCLRIIIRFAF